MLANRLDEAIMQAASAAEPAHLAKYAFTLARAFSLFYHHNRIIDEEDLTRQAVLITVTEIVQRQMTSALATLGISIPERM